jgi:endo-1,4-beta-xylanase
MRSLLICPALLTCIAGWGQDAPNLIANGDLSDGPKGWSITQNETCASSIIDAEVAEFTKALRLALKPRPGADPWSILLQNPINAFIDEGDRLQLRIWMRSPESCRVTAYVEVREDPYTKSISETFALTPEWKEYTIEGAAAQDYDPMEARVGFHLGFDEGTVEITGVQLVDLDVADDARGERPTMEKPVSMIANGDFSESLEGNWGEGDGERLKVSVIDADIGGYGRAARLECRPEPDQPAWNLQFGQRCTGYVRAGDAIYFRAWLRSRDRCRVSFIYEMAEPPHTKAISQLVHLTPDWQEYRFMGRPDRGFRPEQSAAKFFLGHDEGTVEIAGVRVENCGEAPDSAFDQTIDYWAGREHPDTWREPALARIERVRKSDLTIRVLDAEGKPVSGAKVTVKQKRHHFRFGTALPAGRLVDTENADNLRFQQEVERLFNTVTFENDLKWPSMSDERLQTVDRAVEWLHERDIEARGHCLLWGSYGHIPSPTKELRGQQLLDACKSHVTDYATRMRGKLYLWDVVNEAGSNVEVWEEIGWEAFPDSFGWARTADPDTLLCYNDYGIVDERPGYREKVAERIRTLLDHDAPLDVLGIQAHMHVPLTPIHRVLEILDDWAEFGKDLEITEFDLGCWDDEVHAEYVRDFMIAAFSHPSVKAFIQWGFWEGSHWRSKAGGAMFRRDWSKRPAQEAYEDLVLNQWWTDWQGETSDGGTASLRAFYGEHEVTAEATGKRGTATVSLVPGEEQVVELRLE